MNSNLPSKITDTIIKEIRSSMSTLYFEPSDFLILRKIVFLSLLHGHNSKKRTIYATPGEAWLAENTELHRVTVSRRVSFLKSKGFLAITYRRQVKGQWQTNLYRFGGVLWAMIQDVTKRFHSFFHRVTRPLHIVTSKGVNTTNSDSDSIFLHDVRDFLTRLNEKDPFNEGPPGLERPGKEEM
jgi:hypothetical protein